MRMTRKICIMIAATAVSFGLLGVTAPAQADTSWGCPGCVGAPPGTDG